MIKNDRLIDWLTKVCNTSYLLQHLLSVITNINGVLTNNNSPRLPLFMNHIIDVLLGIVFYQIITNLLVNIDVGFEIMSLATMVKVRLDSLLDWLMGAPAGLKLNNELSSFLGNFFLFHVDVWMNYLMLIKKYLPLLVQTLLLSSHFGLSMFLAFLNDMINGLCFHLHCFYVYAASLYRVQLKSLLSLSRLFRGKKWNVLRLRVDSINYQADQLILGTIMFTILLFLFPTVALYYSVFVSIHCFVLVIQSLAMLYPSAIYELKLVSMFVIIETKDISGMTKDSKISKPRVSSRLEEVIWKLFLGEII